jgi:hypothetical protein
MPRKLSIFDPFIVIPLFVPISSLCEPAPRFAVGNIQRAEWHYLGALTRSLETA